MSSLKNIDEMWGSIYWVIMKEFRFLMDEFGKNNYLYAGVRPF